MAKRSATSFKNVQVKATPLTYEIFHSLWDFFAEKTKDDPSLFASFDLDVKEDFVCDRLAGR
jgi:hypothetical protein